MIDAERAHLGVLGGRCRADDFRAEVPGDLRRGNTDAAADRINQDSLIALQPAHNHDQLPSCEIVDGNRGRFLRRHPGGALEYLSQGSTDRIGIATESGQREHVASHPARFNACADGVDPTGDLITRHARDRWQVRIEPEAAKYVGEIDAACFNANPHLAGFGFGIGRVLDLENLW